jgi:hypothetical protein
MPVTYLIEHLAHLLSESGRAGLGDLGDSMGITMWVIVTRWPMMISASWNYVYCPFISVQFGDSIVNSTHSADQKGTRYSPVSDLGFGTRFCGRSPVVEVRFQFADEGFSAQRPTRPGVRIDLFGQRLIRRFAQVLWPVRNRKAPMRLTDRTSHRIGMLRHHDQVDVIPHLAVSPDLRPGTCARR